MRKRIPKRNGKEAKKKKYTQHREIVTRRKRILYLRHERQPHSLSLLFERRTAVRRDDYQRRINTEPGTQLNFTIITIITNNFIIAQPTCSVTVDERARWSR